MNGGLISTISRCRYCINKIWSGPLYNLLWYSPAHPVVLSTYILHCQLHSPYFLPFHGYHCRLLLCSLLCISLPNSVCCAHGLDPPIHRAAAYCHFLICCAAVGLCRHLTVRSHTTASSSPLSPPQSPSFLALHSSLFPFFISSSLSSLVPPLATVIGISMLLNLNCVSHNGETVCGLLGTNFLRSRCNPRRARNLPTMNPVWRHSWMGTSSGIVFGIKSRGPHIRSCSYASFTHVCACASHSPH